MKCVNEDNVVSMRFFDLLTGDTFIEKQNTDVFMKITDFGKDNAIRLQDGVTDTFFKDTIVTKVEGTFTYHICTKGD